MGIQHHQEVLQLLKVAVADAEELLESSPEVLVAKLESILKLLNEADMVAPAAGRQTLPASRSPSPMSIHICLRSRLRGVFRMHRRREAASRGQACRP